MKGFPLFFPAAIFFSFSFSPPSGFITTFISFPILSAYIFMTTASFTSRHRPSPPFSPAVTSFFTGRHLHPHRPSPLPASMRHPSQLNNCLSFLYVSDSISIQQYYYKYSHAYLLWDWADQYCFGSYLPFPCMPMSVIASYGYGTVTVVVGIETA